MDTLDTLTWKNCLAYIAPDVQEESFNFIALTAIWLGIPTLVSSQSTIGKFLLSINCPSTKKALINLTGNPEDDQKLWVDKIHKDILNHTARSIQWAKELSEYLHDHTELRDFSVTILGPPSRAISPDVISSPSSPDVAVDNRSGIETSFQHQPQASTQVSFMLFVLATIFLD